MPFDPSSSRTLARQMRSSPNRPINGVSMNKPRQASKSTKTTSDVGCAISCPADAWGNPHRNARAPGSRRRNRMAAVSKFALATGIDPRGGLDSALTDLFAQLTPKYHEVFRERVKRMCETSARSTGSILHALTACSLGSECGLMDLRASPDQLERYADPALCGDPEHPALSPPSLMRLAATCVANGRRQRSARLRVPAAGRSGRVALS